MDMIDLPAFPTKNIFVNYPNEKVADGFAATKCKNAQNSFSPHIISLRGLLRRAIEIYRVFITKCK